MSKDSMAIAYALKKRKKMADGGEAQPQQPPKQVAPVDPNKVKSMGMDIFKAEGGEIEPEHDEDDIVERCMRKHMSEGGEVANGGEDDLDQMADGKPNEFDDLALRDGLESSYTGANSGDELGNEQLDHDEHDIIERIMKSRSKKDKLPNPR